MPRLPQRVPTRIESHSRRPSNCRHWESGRIGSVQDERFDSGHAIDEKVPSAAGTVRSGATALNAGADAALGWTPLPGGTLWSDAAPPPGILLKRRWRVTRLHYFSTIFSERLGESS